MKRDEWAGLVGRSVTVETVTGTTVAGRVYACDAVTNTLVLERPSTTGGPSARDYDVFKINMLASVAPSVDMADAPPLTTPGPVNLGHIEAAERQRLAAAEQALDRVGIDVSPEAQACFNRLAKTYGEPGRGWRRTDVSVQRADSRTGAVLWRACARRALVAHRLPCRWAGKSIVVLDGDVVVAPPYTPEACTGKDGPLAHVRKIVRGP